MHAPNGINGSKGKMRGGFESGADCLAKQKGKGNKPLPGSAEPWSPAVSQDAQKETERFTPPCSTSDWT